MLSNMSVDLNAATIFNGLTTLVIAIIGYMLKGVYGDFKEAMKTVAKHEIELAVLKERVDRIEEK